MRCNLFVAFLASAALASTTLAQPVAAIARQAASFDESSPLRPEDLKRIRDAGSLGGGTGDWAISGRFDYRFDVSAAGWYELLLDGPADGVTFLLDPDPAGGAATTFEGARAEGAKPAKAGNLFLSTGAHTLRIQRFFWTGFPQLRGFRLNPSPPLAATTTRAAFESGGTVFGVKACPDVVVVAGSALAPVKLVVQTKDSRGTSYATRKVELPALSQPKTIKIPTYCSEGGRFIVEFNDGSSGISWRDVPALIYQVVDTQPPPGVTRGNGVLVQDIDAATIPPDYFAGGTTRSVTAATGRYRESGDVGFTTWQRAPAPVRLAMPEPSWFAYRLAGLVAQQPHVVEIDYPDDALRTQLFELREAVPLAMTAGGVDTGGEFSLSGRTATYRLLFWPKTADVRLVVLNAHNGRRAAIARIRVYRMEGALGDATASSGGRQVINWYEEGSNFTGLYGAPTESPDNTLAAIARWAEAVAASGGTTLMPTVAVYSFGLYPSRFNRVFSRWDSDLLRAILLHAGKRNLKVIAEVHPRADELEAAFPGPAESKPNLLRSRDGGTNYFGRDGRSRNYPPLYGPLHPANQQWYVNMVGELADNYRDAPAFAGVSLRLMQWANPALNNFASLDWGYDDYTVSLFSRETGIALPVPAESSTGDAAANAKARYEWLMSREKQHWIQWRCEKIAQLYRRIRDRVRAARADLVVYSPAFSWAPGGDRESLRAAGVDPDLLGAIDGVMLVDARTRYGRREPDLVVTQAKRDDLVDPLRMTALASPARAGAFLATAEYVETTEAVAPPEQMGFPKETRAIWNSAAVSPAGRHVIERYALELADTDTQMIGDGGNGYSIPQPVLQEFLAEFRKLPAQRFAPRADARDPVAAWELSLPSRFYFYVVNRERYPVDVNITFARAGPVERLATGRPQPLEGTILKLRLLPYQLAGFAAAAGQVIRAIEATPPAAEVERARSQVAWLEKLDRDPPFALKAEERAVVHRHAVLARAALDVHAWWRARTLVENHALMKIYLDIGHQPPGLLNAPVKPD